MAAGKGAWHTGPSRTADRPRFSAENVRVGGDKLWDSPAIPSPTAAKHHLKEIDEDSTGN